MRPSKWQGREWKETVSGLTGGLKPAGRGLESEASDSPLVTLALCFYNPHITAWKAGQSNGDPGIQPPGEAWQFLGDRPRARAFEMAAIFSISQEH